MSMFLKFARAIKEFRLAQGDITAAQELEGWEDMAETAPELSTAQYILSAPPAPNSQGRQQSQPQSQRAASASGKRTAQKRATGKAAWQEKPYHDQQWAPPVETFGLDPKEVLPSLCSSPLCVPRCATRGHHVWLRCVGRPQVAEGIDPTMAMGDELRNMRYSLKACV